MLLKQKCEELKNKQIKNMIRNERAREKKKCSFNATVDIL